MSSRIIVADDEPAVRFMLRAVLEDEGFAVIEACDGQDALAQLDKPGGVDLIISDIVMPKLDGMGLLRALASRPNSPPLILVTARGSERTAVEAIKSGALDYFSKPLDAEQIIAVVTRALRTANVARENDDLRAAVVLGRHMIFAAQSMRRLALHVARIAPLDITVLITGESGTGKELIARALVDGSARSGAPFVRFSCAGLPDNLLEAELFGHTKGAFSGASQARQGLFRRAHGGTLLLDEVAELSPSAQASLLRVLQEGTVRPVGSDEEVPVDVRVLAATNRDLQAGGFRQDLYYRLNVVTLHIPPLRERSEDIEPLARHFVSRFGQRFGRPAIRVTPGLMESWTHGSWPGNVRELEHCIERRVALADSGLLDIEHDSAQASSSASQPELPLAVRLDAFERGLLADALQRCGGNQSEAARQLSINRSTMLSKMKKHDLS